MSGWIQLHRSLIDWEWYDDANTMRLFLHCCLRANFEDAKWRGIDIKRGTFITSIKTLSEELKLSESKIKLSIKKLKTTNEIAIKTTNKNTTVTVCNYDTYNNLKKQNDKPNSNQPDNQTTNKQQTEDNQTATDKKNNNNKQEKEVITKQLKEHLQTFEQFRQIYKGTKVGNVAEFANFKKKTKDWKEVLPDLKALTECQINIKDTMRAAGQFVPEWKNLKTWINQRCWEEEYTMQEKRQGNRPINVIDTQEKDYSEPF